MGRNIPRIAACPVCGMPVTTRKAEHAEERQGRVYFFCADGCRRRWLEENPCCGSSKGWWGRYIDRLGKANTGTFGSAGPKCH